MIKIFDFINSIKKEYDITQLPFLKKQLERVRATQPYKGVKILHNIPFTKETVLKLEILYAGGAELTITSPSFMQVDPDLLNQFIISGGNWVEKVIPQNLSYDICMDCAGELLGLATPKIGTVEITGTGTNKYREAKTNYPVISVDQSKIKNLEAVLGTGEAFVRAFIELSNENIKDKKFMVFGYGKVGKGIVHYLKKYTKDIVVIDILEDNLKKALEEGLTPVSANNKEYIEKLASETFAVVTATGIKNVVSKSYDPKAFASCYLANMGGEDEFGDGFENKDVMCDKKPINFFIDHPTLIRYLDPVFYAHNMGIDLLLYANLQNGLHPFPEFLSEEIVTEWEHIFNEKLK